MCSWPFAISPLKYRLLTVDEEGPSRLVRNLHRKVQLLRRTSRLIDNLLHAARHFTFESTSRSAPAKAIDLPYSWRGNYMKSKLEYCRVTVRTLSLLSIWMLGPPVASADTILGTAQSFALLGGAGVTVAGAQTSTISGNVGDYPLGLSSITGFPPGVVVNGTIYAADQNAGNLAVQAQSDEIAAYNGLAALSGAVNLSGIVLGTVSDGATPGYSTLLPGIYSFSGGAPSAQVDGTLVLDFQNQTNTAFVFQIGTTLTTASGASIVVENGNASDSIFWQVGSSATLGSGTTFSGNILAYASISLGTTASIGCGRAFAQTGSVTLDDNFISNDCSIDNTASGYSPSGVSDFGSTGFSSVSDSPGVPEPGTAPLLCGGLLLAISHGRRRRKHAALRAV